MAFIDGTVVNVALPALQRSLGASLADAQWIIEAYELTLGALLLIGGAAGDRFGRRRVFGIGVIVFIAASVACGLSDRVGLLIAARVLQGFGGALLVPGSLALLSASFDGEQRGRAIGTWAACTALATALGPVMGGFLIDHASWRYAFFLNVPIALIVLVLTFRYVPESRATPRVDEIDWLGAGLAATGLGGIIYALIEVPTAGWGDGVVLSALAVGALALAAFLVAEARQTAPMLPLAMFRSRDFLGANLLTLLLYAALGGSLFYLPLNLIQVQGYSTTAAGAALLPLVLTMFALSRWAGAVVERHGAKLPLVIGPAIAASGFALFALSDVGGSYWITIFPAALVLGLGMAVTVAPLTTTVMRAAGRNAAGIASGVNNAVSSVAALFAVAGLGIVMAHTFNFELHRGLQAHNLPLEISEAVESQRARLAAIEPPTHASADASVAIEHEVAAAFLAGFRRIMLIGAALALASAGSAWLFISGRGARPFERSETSGP